MSFVYDLFLWIVLVSVYLYICSAFPSFKGKRGIPFLLLILAFAVLIGLGQSETIRITYGYAVSRIVFIVLLFIYSIVEWFIYRNHEKKKAVKRRQMKQRHRLPSSRK